MSIKIKVICQKGRKNIMSNRINKYKTVASITTELINLESILKLPKPTEAFMSDIHGEFNAFQQTRQSVYGFVVVYVGWPQLPIIWQTKYDYI